MSNTRRRWAPYAGIGLGITTASTAAILIRLAQADAHSLVIAAWRLTLATLILAPVALLTRRAELRALTRREWLALLAAGVMLAIHFAAWITSLAYTSVAASTVLVSASPIFAALASPLVLRERLPRSTPIALLVAASGSVIIGLADWGKGAHHLQGDILALIGAAGAAGYFLAGRRLRARLSLLAYVFPVYGSSALVLLGIMGLSGMPALPRQPQTWLWLLLLALGPQIVGHSSLNWALRYLSAAFVTIATLGEPIASTLLAWWVLQERPSPWVIVGGALICIGIGVASQAERPTDQPPDGAALPRRNGR